MTVQGFSTEKRPSIVYSEGCADVRIAGPAGQRVAAAVRVPGQ